MYKALTLVQVTYWLCFPFHIHHSNNWTNFSHSSTFSPDLTFKQDLPEWLTSLKWCSSSPSSPLHSQPSLLCVHNTWSWFNDLFRPLFGNTSKLSSLHVGQGLCSASRRSLHVWQKLVPQHLDRYGSRSIRLHIGHSVWKTLWGASTNSQSYPPNVSCCGLPWGSAPPSAPSDVLVGGVFFRWASSASCVCTYSHRRKNYIITLIRSLLSWLCV